MSLLFFKASLLESDILHSANDSALEIYNGILEIEPTNAKAWYLEGCVLFDIGRENESKKCFDMARHLGYLE
jgi:hypothetical protein